MLMTNMCFSESGSFIRHGSLSLPGRNDLASVLLSLGNAVPSAGPRSQDF